MPVVRNIPLDLDIREVLRRAGVRQPSGTRPHIAETLRGLMAEVAAHRLLGPALAYQTYVISEVGPKMLLLDCGAVLQGPFRSSSLSGARELAAVVVTVGGELEAEASRCFQSGEALRGLLLDAIGSAAVDSLTQNAVGLVADMAAAVGYQASCPVSPGMAGFPLSEQREVLRLAHAKEIGVSLTTSGVMVPRKSASLVFGLGPHMAGRGPGRGCAHCSLSRTCPQRRLTATEHGGTRMLV